MTRDSEKTILVTGAASFIGYHFFPAVAGKGYRVAGADSVNDYYDTKLKRARLKALRVWPFFVYRRRPGS
ncbi:MAG: NAD-dependent epimerase/dehydratase family protein [Eubacteriales bacterium]